MKLFDRLGVRQLIHDDAAPVCFHDKANRITYLSEVRRSAFVTATAQTVFEQDKPNEIFSLRAEPYMGDFHPVSFRYFGWHYRPDDNALALACAVFEAIRAERVPDCRELMRRFPVCKNTERIKLVYSRGED